MVTVSQGNEARAREYLRAIVVAPPRFGITVRQLAGASSRAVGRMLVVVKGHLRITADVTDYDCAVRQGLATYGDLGRVRWGAVVFAHELAVAGHRHHGVWLSEGVAE